MPAFSSKHEKRYALQDYIPTLVDICIAALVEAMHYTKRKYEGLTEELNQLLQEGSKSTSSSFVSYLILSILIAYPARYEWNDNAVHAIATSTLRELKLFGLVRIPHPPPPSFFFSFVSVTDSLTG